SNGPSNASRSSGSSATALTGRTLWSAADAAFRHSHLRPRRRGGGPRARRGLGPALRPDERHHREGEDRDRDVEVQAQTEVLVRGVDTQRLLVGAKRRVPGDVEGEEARGPDLEAPVDEEEEADAEQVPQGLVEEEWMERRLGDVLLGPVPDVDLEPPRKIGRLAEGLLVEVLAPTCDDLA